MTNLKNRKFILSFEYVGIEIQSLDLVSELHGKKTIEMPIKFFFPDCSWFSFAVTIKFIDRKHEVFEFKSASHHNHSSIGLKNISSFSMQT